MSVRRWVKRYEENGAESLVDQRLAKAAHNVAGIDEVLELLVLFETKYRDFNGNPPVKSTYSENLFKLLRIRKDVLLNEFIFDVD